MFNKLTEAARSYYRLLTSGLNRAEIERLVKVDTRDMLTYYARSMERPAAEGRRVKRVLIFAKNLFFTFLLKLTPARRLLYAIALGLFVLALLDLRWSYAVYTFVILNFLLALELADKLIEKDELAVARQIQLSLLPENNSHVPGFEVATFSDVARNVGGDYYDFIPLADGSTLAVVGDVSGKGISAALYAVKVQTLLQLLAKESSDPCELLLRLNRHLYGQLQRTYFLTIALLKVHADGKIEYCRAGHTPLLLWDSHSQRTTWLEPKGAAVGVVPPGPGSGARAEPATDHRGGRTARASFEEILEPGEHTLGPGDVLVLFTDGVIETLNGRRQEFGESRLAKILSHHASDSPKAIREALIRELIRFRGGNELNDDVTLVILKRHS